MRRAPYALIAVAVAAVGLLALRDTDAFLRPDFWAEDGRAFFRGWNMFGWSSFIEPYAGYLHLIPRIVAAAAGVGLYYWWYQSLDKTMPVFAVLVYLVSCIVGSLLTAMVQNRPAMSATAIALMSAPFAPTAAGFA